MGGDPPLTGAEPERAVPQPKSRPTLSIRRRRLLGPTTTLFGEREWAAMQAGTDHLSSQVRDALVVSKRVLHIKRVSSKASPA